MSNAISGLSNRGNKTSPWFCFRFACPSPYQGEGFPSGLFEVLEDFWVSRRLEAGGFIKFGVEKYPTLINTSGIVSIYNPLLI
ncbi:hypothetical protein [Cylindrospermum sp. FACHB-282]|uniref:hypothetical protein n=1 Tax=Cylindrospermum sp. FACHB-282 TaxID=2692794 RepID=UPI00168743E5|nr:hypothetical protein [Cylindrospermum sp. FACHB-282]MBD2383898.1 hypothetical protein [Cylindrospermum sp. FACHB-282]